MHSHMPTHQPIQLLLVQLAPLERQQCSLLLSLGDKFTCHLQFDCSGPDWLCHAGSRTHTSTKQASKDKIIVHQRVSCL